MTLATDFDYSPYRFYPGFRFRGPLHEIGVVTNLVWYYRYQYYVLGGSDISDEAYDRLEQRLAWLCRRWKKGFPRPYHSPLVTVGSSLHQTYPTHIRRYFERTYPWGVTR
jgi:hypothetical protein